MVKTIRSSIFDATSHRFLALHAPRTSGEILLPGSEVYDSLRTHLAFVARPTILFPSLFTTFEMQTGRPKKQQRASRACDLCHRRSIRCRPSVEDPTSRCQNCHDFEVQCTYLRPLRRGNVQERIVREEHLGASLERCKIEAVGCSPGSATACPRC